MSPNCTPTTIPLPELHTSNTQVQEKHGERLRAIAPRLLSTRFARCKPSVKLGCLAGLADFVIFFALGIANKFAKPMLLLFGTYGSRDSPGSFGFVTGDALLFGRLLVSVVISTVTLSPNDLYHRPLFSFEPGVLESLSVSTFRSVVGH